ncbi:hypothetical protein [Aureimonas pseudogalii]|uniref:Uncharacterized protein n=1 Tax=Aureimonas pseudogalii TaxID=1744844 RepID=A0A7W6EBW2_9HYPH|nr:hypothetical protein [Aureimonas pseudogalii]MBB3997181.1 hypothetical protein [Aureimonas pseudogalii]
MTSLLIALLLSASPALAASDCGTYTLESRPPGERVATIEDERVLTIKEAGEVETYDLVSAGTGLPYMEGQPANGAEGDPVEVLEHKGDLIVNSMVFVPFCGAAN